MIADVIPFRNNQISCTACALHTTLNGGCQLLWGTGPQDARFMIVGEAPGTQESREGRPFIGESGTLLNKLMAKAGLRRENVFVTNAVRCQPPIINRKQTKPKKPSIVACREHLKREIDLVKPELIFACGNTPLESLTGASGITKLHGTMHTTSKKHFGVEIPVMPTYHPTYAIREPAREKDITLDFITGLRMIDGGFNVIDCDFKLYQEFGPPGNFSPFWSWDIETNARELDDPDLCVWMLSIDDGTNIIMFQSLYIQDAIDIMARYVAGGGQLVGQNASAFDRMIIKKLYGANLRTHDTQLLWHLLDEEAATNLQAQAIRAIGVEPWKDGFDKDFWWNWASKTKEEQLASEVYNARDTRYTRMIFEEYRKHVPPQIWNLYLRHNLPVSRALAEVEHHGVYLSLENIDTSAAELEVEQRIALLHLQDLTRPDFNPGSYQQVRELLFSDLMLPVQKTTNGGDPSTDAEVLKKLQSLNLGGPVIDTVWKYRKSSKLLQFLRTYKEARPPHGWAKPSYSMTTTVNYRTSSFGAFNPQQTPRDKRVRKAIAAPPGWKIVEADYKMLELYVAAELAGPQSALYQALLRGEDVHKTMACRLTGKTMDQLTDQDRNDAKPANFAFLYYADEPTYMRQALVDYDRIVSFEEGTLAKAAFRAWGVEPWWDQVFAELEEYGEVQSIFGAVRRLPAIGSRDKYNQLEAKREALNFTDASVACHIAELAVAQAVGRGARVGAFIHDALLVYAPAEDNGGECITAEDEALLLQHDMEVVVPQLIQEIFGYKFSLPLKAKVTIGDFWGDKS